MNVWIVKENEFVDLISGKARSSRAAMLADYFIEQGCKITAWSSLWSHNLKSYLYEEREIIEIKKGLKLHVLPATKEYNSNISFARIAQERQIAKLFKKAIWNEPENPDLIYCCWPLIETSYEAVRYGKKNNIPVIIDIRDLWPDIFIQPFPSLLKPFAKIGINFLFKKQVSFALQNATLITGTTQKAMELPEEYGRKKNLLDHYVMHCYRKPLFSEKELNESLAKWFELGIDSSSFNVIYFGNISKRIGDFDSLLFAADKLTDKNIKFIICGTGIDYNSVANEATKRSNVVMAGLRNQLDLISLASISQAGLIPYRNTPDFIDSLPTKFSEYLSNSLIIFTSLKGLSKTILEENECGLYYSNGESLAELIQKYYFDRKILLESKQNAQRLFKRYFDADIVYKNFITELIGLTKREDENE